MTAELAAELFLRPSRYRHASAANNSGNNLRLLEAFAEQPEPPRYRKVAEVRLILPVTTESPMVEDSAHPSPAPTTVLIVEDEFLFFMDAEETLVDHGYRVIGPAATVEQALQLLDQERPDVVLLDVKLKGQWSTPVAGALREAGIPFLLISSYSVSALEPSGLLEGTQYLGRPVEERRLIRAVSALTKKA